MDREGWVEAGRQSERLTSELLELVPHNACSRSDTLMLVLQVAHGYQGVLCHSLQKTESI
jgi:hypothetical protein